MKPVKFDKTGISYTVKCCSNSVQYINILHTLLQELRQDINSIRGWTNKRHSIAHHNSSLIMIYSISHEIYTLCLWSTEYPMKYTHSFVLVGTKPNQNCVHIPWDILYIIIKEPPHEKAVSFSSILHHQYWDVPKLPEHVPVSRCVLFSDVSFRHEAALTDCFILMC